MPKNKIKYNPKAVIEDMKENKRKTFVFSLNLALLNLVVFALAFFFGRGLLFILIPFVLLPWSFASMVTILYQRDDKASAPSYFHGSLRSFYRENLLVSYRLIRNYFISWAISLAVGVLTGIIYYYSSSNPELEKLLSQAYFYMSNGDTNMLNALLSTESALTKMISVITATKLASFFLVFVHQMSVFGLSPMLVGFPFYDRDVNRIFTGSVKSNRKEFFKMYYGMIYPLLILWIVCGVGGYFLSALIPGIYLEQRVLFAIGVGLSLTLLAFKYYAHALHLMKDRCSDFIHDFVLDRMKKTIDDPSFSGKMSEEDIAWIRKTIEEMKKTANDENNPCDSSALNDNGGIESEDQNNEDQ